MRAFDARPARALAVFAHPDDPEVACAGTLARWAAAGADVRLVVCNQGDKGSLDPAADTVALARAREAEVAAAAEELGLAGHELLGFPDGELVNDEHLRSVLVACIRRLRPEVVVCPDPTAVFFGDSYVNHRDHREVGWAVLDAVAPAAASPHYFPDAGDAHQVEVLLLSGSLEPDAYVDITEAVEQKVRAVAAHRTQVGEDPALVAEVMNDRAAEVGRRAGVEFAEAYRLLRLAGDGR